jgi:hypothetical protein
MAAEYFSRLGGAEIGIHHPIAGAYFLRCAQESSWRKDNRRVCNGDQVTRKGGVAQDGRRMDQAYAERRAANEKIATSVALIR